MVFPLLQESSGHQCRENLESKLPSSPVPRLIHCNSNNNSLWWRSIANTRKRFISGVPMRWVQLIFFSMGRIVEWRAFAWCLTAVAPTPTSMLKLTKLHFRWWDPASLKLWKTFSPTTNSRKLIISTCLQVRKYLNGKLKETADESLPVCWRGAKPFKSIFEVKNYFKPFALSFTKAKSAQLQLPPESYLIISVRTLKTISSLLVWAYKMRFLTVPFLSETWQRMLGDFEWFWNRTWRQQRHRR